MHEPDVTLLGLHSACGAEVWLYEWTQHESHPNGYSGSTACDRVECEKCGDLHPSDMGDVTTRDQRDYIDGATVDELRQERVRLLAEPVGDVGEALWTYLVAISTELRRRANG